MDILEFLNPENLIKAFGLLGIFIIVFLESGVFFGFFFPGDSLLFTAGFLASQGFLPIIPLTAGIFISAILGDNVGYWFGKKTGPALFVKENSLFFKKEYISRAEHFYEKHGRMTIILARFMPIIRTFAPIVAGIGNMKYNTFVLYNVIGAFIWSFGMVLSGYFLGQIVPHADRYLLYIIILIILTSFIPPAVHFFKNRKSQQEIK